MVECAVHPVESPSFSFPLDEVVKLSAHLSFLQGWGPQSVNRRWTLTGNSHVMDTHDPDFTNMVESSSTNQTVYMTVQEKKLEHPAQVPLGNFKDFHV